MYKTREERQQVRVIERVAEHYDTQEMEFGRIYRWCPECVVVECDCGERMTLKRLDIIIDPGVTCEECGAKVSPRIREEVVIELLDEDDAAIHPWRHDAQAQAAQTLHELWTATSHGHRVGLWSNI